MPHATPSLSTVHECGYGGLKAPMPPHNVELPSMTGTTFGEVFVWMSMVEDCLSSSQECACKECPHLALCSGEAQGMAPFFYFLHSRCMMDAL